MSIYRNIGISLYTLSAAFAAVLLPSCSPRVATSFWRIGTPADSAREGYAVIHAEGKTRHCYPITEWTSTDEKEDVYHSLHHHGVAVESELMAYRIYFDKKQTIDPYCKRKPQLELAQSHWYPNDSLLEAGYGDDILRVSGTVGVGSVKYWDGKMRHIEHVEQRSQRILKQQKDQATIGLWRVTDICAAIYIQPIPWKASAPACKPSLPRAGRTPSLSFSPTAFCSLRGAPTGP